MIGFFRSSFRRSMASFDAHPYIGNCMLGVTIGVAGDALAQVCFPETKGAVASSTEITAKTETSFDWKRSGSIAAYSAVVYPLLTRWYLFTEGK
jgi:hypothetical protein